MKVKDVYQDSEGNWHIDYDANHLMGLAIRVYFGQMLITLCLIPIFLVLGIFIGIVFGKPLPTENKIPQTPNFQYEHIPN
ncbi:MAG: hypothetical protein QNJ64_01320 [Crocosphaera sp.]|nr:hypothetical protein [Crocosphaera sp.]